MAQQGLFDMGGGLCRESSVACSLGQGLGRERLFVRTRNRDGHHVAGKTAEMAQEAFGILEAEHADNKVQWPWRALFQVGHGLRQCGAGGGVVTTVQPKL